MPSFTDVCAANKSAKLPYSPTALFVGATNGIGEASALAYASMYPTPKITISGRSQERGLEMTAAMTAKNSRCAADFQKVDMTLISDIDRFAADYASRHQKLNLLFVSPGILSMDGRTETTEGNDRKYMLHYLGRFLLISRLLPLLRNAAEQNEQATVVSVLAAGLEDRVFLDDFELKKKYGLRNVAAHATSFNSLMVEEYAKREPKISFIHIAPGFVRTNLAVGLPWYLRAIAKPMGYLGTDPSVCGEHMIYAATHYVTPGSYLIGRTGDKVQFRKRDQIAPGDTSARVWRLSNEFFKL